MGITTVLKFLLVLLGSVAAQREAKKERSDSACIGHFVPSPEKISDDMVEDCFQHPEIAALADDYTGAAADKRSEVFVQCAALEYNCFTDGVLDPEKYKSFIASWMKGTRFEAVAKEGIASCESILLQPHQVISFLRCIADYC